MEDPASFSRHAAHARTEPDRPTLPFLLAVHDEVTRRTVIGPTGREREPEELGVHEQPPGLVAVSLAQERHERPQRLERAGHHAGVVHGEALAAIRVDRLADHGLDGGCDGQDRIRRRGREHHQLGEPIVVQVGERGVGVQAQVGAVALVLDQVPVVAVAGELQVLEPHPPALAALPVDDRGCIRRARQAGPPRADARLHARRERRALHAQVRAAIPEQVAHRLHARAVGIAHQHEHDARHRGVVHHVDIEPERIERRFDGRREQRVLASQPAQEPPRGLPHPLERHDALLGDGVRLLLPESHLGLGHEPGDRVGAGRRPRLHHRGVRGHREQREPQRDDNDPQRGRRRGARRTGSRREHGQRIRGAGSRPGQVRNGRPGVPPPRLTTGEAWPAPDPENSTSARDGRRHAVEAHHDVRALGRVAAAW